MKPLALAVHASRLAGERGLHRGWIEQTVRAPTWREPDATGIERRFGAIAERGGRILRAACIETDTEIRAITAFFDRNARRPA